MRVAIISFIIFVLIGSTVYGVDYKKKNHHDHHMNILDNVDIDIDNGTLILKDKESADEVEITEKYDLFVNGKEISLDDEQRELVKDYYDLYFEIIEYAKHIGLEGARIGIEGAAIGVKAVAGVFKLLSDDYDSEDLEAELEEKSNELEAKAERLENRAEDIEDMTDELEDLHYKLADKIDALGDLEMFQ